MQSSVVRLVTMLIRYAKYKKRYVKLFTKYNIGKKWGFYKCGDIEIGEGSDFQSARQHTTNFRTFTFGWHIHIMMSNVHTQFFSPKTVDKRHNGVLE